jgi:transcriptional regulator with XRE-family HTH domain
MARVFDGRRLRDQRKLAGIPASALAARVGRTTWAVWAWERGQAHPSVDVALQLADALAVPLEVLLTETRLKAVA